MNSTLYIVLTATLLVVYIQATPVKEDAESHIRRIRDLTTYNSTLKPNQLKPEHLVPAGVLFGEYCPWFRLLFFAAPLYFCPTPTKEPSIILESEGDATGVGFRDLGDDNDIDVDRPNYIPDSPIDLTPAKPKRPMTGTPPPVYHGAKSEDAQYDKESLIPVFSTARPVIASTSLPPSKCTLAIANCCKAGARGYDLRCFEQMQCPGPFWDTNPCSAESVEGAIKTISNYNNN